MISAVFSRYLDSHLPGALTPQVRSVDEFRRPMQASLHQSLAGRLERFLAHGTAQASREDALVIRRARGFALIGLAVVVLMAGVSSFSHDPLHVLIGTAVLLAFMAGGLALGFVQQARWIRPITHGGMGAMLAGIFASTIQVGQGNDTSATFPILLILVTSYVLGVKAAAFWTLASIVGIGLPNGRGRVPGSPGGLHR